MTKIPIVLVNYGLASRYNNFIEINNKIKGKLLIQPGAKIELSDPGILVCEGEVIINGESKNVIEIFGNSNFDSQNKHRNMEPIF